MPVAPSHHIFTSLQRSESSLSHWQFGFSMPKPVHWWRDKFEGISEDNLRALSGSPDSDHFQPDPSPWIVNI